MYKVARSDRMRFRTKNSVTFLPPANEVWGKVIFSQASVTLSTGGGVHGRGSMHGGGRGMHGGGHAW